MNGICARASRIRRSALRRADKLFIKDARGQQNALRRVIEKKKICVYLRDRRFCVIRRPIHTIRCYDRIIAV